MLTIPRSCSYRIITRAVSSGDRPLVGLLLPGAEDCDFHEQADTLQAALRDRPDAIVVYNQHADALAMVEGLDAPATQIYIEIRQDTKGVLGLHALERAPSGKQTLELIYEEN